MKTKIAILTLVMATMNAWAGVISLTVVKQSLRGLYASTSSSSSVGCIVGVAAGAPTGVLGFNLDEANKILDITGDGMAVGGVLIALDKQKKINFNQKNTNSGQILRRVNLPTVVASIPLGFIAGGAGAYICGWATFAAIELGQYIIFEE